MIYETNESFDFGKNLHYLSPKSIPGGNYFIKCQSPGNNALYIQTPKCVSKQKLVKTGKKMYGDLVFTQDDESFLKWMEEFEAHCQKTLFENKAEWFDSELEMHDIENSFAASLKIYKSGKQHVLRANIPMRLGKCALKIYDEQEQEVDADTIMENTPIITILEVQGIRCSSRSFQLEYEIKQMLVLNPVDIFDKCVLLSKTKGKENERVDKGLVKREEEEKQVPLVKEEVEKEVEKEEEKEEVEKEEEKEEVEKEEEKKEEKDLGIQVEKDKTNNLEAIDLILPEDSSETETIQLKKRNEVYFEMYKEAKRKAKMAREFALSACLEAKRIKNTYLIDEALDSDEEDLENPDMEERGNDE